MIYTITFNPSLDYIVTVEDFKMNLTNRTSSELMLPGGKGINVSFVLNNLGIENTALYYSAGFVGEEITKRIEEAGIHAEKIVIPNGNSRINMKLKNYDGTEINGMGPDISKEKVEELFEKLDMVKDYDVVVLAGSIPKTMPDSIYKDIMEKLSCKNVKVVVDATKNLLLNVLEYKPFLIKPNNHELGDLFGVQLKTKEEVIPYAKKLKDMGAVNVLISMSKEGAVLIDEFGQAHVSEAPKGILVNAVGSGDSMVAGFIAGYLEKNDYEYAFKMGLSAGSASAFSEYLATKEEVMKLYNTIK
jgi:1-phosphofructokinase